MEDENKKIVMDEDREITISLGFYNILMQRSTMLAQFENYVNGEEFSIPREMCGRILGFNVREVKK